MLMNHEPTIKTFLLATPTTTTKVMRKDKLRREKV
jgi:hypothetical protein